MNTKEKIRTLGFYQPFGSLMFHGKIETRWIRKGKKPPFPLGKYVLYTTKKDCSLDQLIEWSGPETINRIDDILYSDDHKDLNGVALGVADLVEVRLLTIEDEAKSFVKFVGEKTEVLNGVEVTKVQWALIFKNVKRLASPVFWNYGKQGVGFLPEWYYNIINFI